MNATRIAVSIVGVGSYLGDDDAGWRAVEVCREALPAEQWPGLQLEFVKRADPGPDLIDVLSGSDLSIIIDAMQGGGEPGEVKALSLAQLCCRPGGVSSHSLDIPQCIELARRLSSRDVDVAIVGIEMGAAPGERALLDCVSQLLTERTQFLPSRLDR